MATSHVFVTMGDIRNIACDAWLLPTDHTPPVNLSWTAPIPGLTEAVSPARAAPFYDDEKLAFAVTDWPLHLPLPVLTAVPLPGFAKAKSVLPPLRQFIRVAAGAARARQQNSNGGFQAMGASRRPVPLLALPLFGTGGGGGAKFRGEVMQCLLDECRRLGPTEQVDFVLVLRNRNDFALAQQTRTGSSESWWSELNLNLQAHAGRLAGLASDGQLVPFMGAGVSISAGGPTWTQLMDRLAKSAGLDLDSLEKLKERNVLDQASILGTILDESGHKLRNVVADEVRMDRYGLAPALLSSLPCKAAITLNYDELFEQASRDAGASLSVIPSGFKDRTDRWLLKLHGTVSDPKSIILTREDYLAYNAVRSALSALVEANLITHHLLFVGFGLTDDHFHEIVFDVRRAFEELSAEKQDIGTAITFFNDPLDEYAWKGKLTLLPLTDGGDVATAARLLEIFLDMLLAHATDSHSYLLADGYEEVLTETGASLREKLLALDQDLTPSERASSEGARVVALLNELGAGKRQLPLA